MHKLCYITTFETSSLLCNGIIKFKYMNERVGTTEYMYFTSHNFIELLYVKRKLDYPFSLDLMLIFLKILLIHLKRKCSIEQFLLSKLYHTSNTNAITLK